MELSRQFYQSFQEYHKALVLGPLLFLIYINVLTCVVSNGKVVMYADDIALYQIIQSPDYLLLQDNVNAISEWVAANFLALNFLKCCPLNISRKGLPTIPACPLGISGNTLNQVNQFKYLGIIFTPDLSWSSHIDTIC